MHATPADLALGGEALAVAFSDDAGLTKCLGDELGVARGILVPLRRRGSGINANHPVAANAKFAQLPGNTAGFLHLGEKCLPLLLGTHGRAAASRWPHRGNHRADHKITLRNTVDKLLQLVIGGVNAGVRQRQKQIDSIETDAIDLSLRSQVQHGFKVDEWFRVRSLAYQAWPHGVVNCRVFVLTGYAHGSLAYFLSYFLISGFASGLPGPKCLSITSGSDALGFSMRTPAFATSAVTNTSSSVISPKRIMEGVDNA